MAQTDAILIWNIAAMLRGHISRTSSASRELSWSKAEDAMRQEQCRQKGKQ